MYCGNLCECEKGLNPRGPRSRALHPRSLGETGKLQAPLRCVFAVSIRFAVARSVHCIGILRKCEGTDPFHARTAMRNTVTAVREGINLCVILYFLCFFEWREVIAGTRDDPVRQIFCFAVASRHAGKTAA